MLTGTLPDTRIDESLIRIISLSMGHDFRPKFYNFDVDIVRWILFFR